MQPLEDILRVLSVAGQEAKKIMHDIHELAESRGARRLVRQLPKKMRELLDEQLGVSTSGEHLGIIKRTIEKNCSEAERRQAYEQALEEVIAQEFLPAALEEATESQRQEIKRIVRDQ